MLVAIKGLVDLKEFKHLYKIDKKEFIIAMIALLGVILFGILKGVLLAAVITLLLLIKAASSPRVAYLGRIKGTTLVSDMLRHPENETIPGVLIVRVEASLLYFNVDYVRNQVWSKIVEEDGSLKTVIFDMSSSPIVDVAGARLLKRLYLDLKAKGISMEIAEALSEVRDLLRVEGLESHFGHISHSVSVNDIIEKVK